MNEIDNMLFLVAILLSYNFNIPHVQLESNHRYSTLNRDWKLPKLYWLYILANVIIQ